MKKWSVLVLGILVVSGGLLYARGGRISPVAFTLATTGGGAASNGSPRMSFRLAGTSLEPAACADPAGSGDIEDASFNTGYGIGTLAVNTGSCNTAIGYWALMANTTGSWNTASGCQALYSNTTGTDNIACGYRALIHNTTGSSNIASGREALWTNTTGNSNVASGTYVLFYNTGDFNTAIGGAAMHLNTAGGWNTAVGGYALCSNTTGAFNIAMGYGAGCDLQTGSYNIILGAYVKGQASDTHTIRIGNPFGDVNGGQNQTFIAGIVENPIDASQNPFVVGITSDAHLGTIPVASLPPGPQGPTGPMGPQGPVGPGLVSGSLLFLYPGVNPPAGYSLLGTTQLSVTAPGAKKATLISVNVYAKQ